MQSSTILFSFLMLASCFILEKFEIILSLLFYAISYQFYSLHSNDQEMKSVKSIDGKFEEFWNFLKNFD